MIIKNQQSTFIFFSDLSVYWFGLNSRSLQAFDWALAEVYGRNVYKTRALALNFTIFIKWLKQKKDNLYVRHMNVTANDSALNKWYICLEAVASNFDLIFI